MRTRFVLVVPRLFGYAAGPGCARPRWNAARPGCCGTPGRPSAGGRRPGVNNGNGPIISVLRYPRSTSGVAPVLWSAAAMRGIQNGCPGTLANSLARCARPTRSASSPGAGDKPSDNGSRPRQPWPDVLRRSPRLGLSLAPGRSCLIAKTSDHRPRNPPVPAMAAGVRRRVSGGITDGRLS